MVSSATDYVAARIAERYANPARAAYLYLFHLKPGSGFSPLAPDPELILSAWVDEGTGLASVPVEAAVERCRAAIAAKPDLSKPQQLTPHQRRQMMSRSILFTVEQPSDKIVTVRLLSRALHFTPKADREAFEEWHPTSGGGWFSAHRPDE
jgi:hypothetical protein